MATALYWSGGKDCTLALLDSINKGMTFDYFITFVGEDFEFRCHPISIMKEQSRQYGVPHLFYVIREPYMFSFLQAIHRLRKNYRINCVVTGDLIDERSEKFEQYWLQKFCLQEGVKLFCPMGNIPRHSALERMLQYKMDARISGIHIDFLPIELLWRKFTIHEMNLMLAREQSHPNFDIAGENGEYHTSVLTCDVFEVSMPQLLQTACTYYEVAYLPLIVPQAPQSATSHIHYLNTQEVHHGRRWTLASQSELATISQRSD